MRCFVERTPDSMLIYSMFKGRLAHAHDVKNVRIGSIVQIGLLDADGGKKQEFVWEIVPEGQTDLSRRRIAFDAPLVKSLIGSCAGAIVRSSLPRDHLVELTIVALYAGWDDVPPEFKNF